MALSTDPLKRDAQLIRYKSKKAGMTEDQYKGFLSLRFGVSSASQLSARQRRQAHAHLNSLLDTRDGRSRDPQLRKIRALWHALADVGAVRVRTDDALESWAKRQHRGLHALRWATPHQQTQLIEALKKWADREGARTE